MQSSTSFHVIPRYTIHMTSNQSTNPPPYGFFGMEQANGYDPSDYFALTDEQINKLMLEIIDVWLLDHDKIKKLLGEFDKKECIELIKICRTFGDAVLNI